MSSIYIGTFDNSMINYEKAFFWSKQAADTGLAIGKTYLASCYINGWGCKTDTDMAIKLLKEAAALGEKFAIEYLNNSGIKF